MGDNVKDDISWEEKLKLIPKFIESVETTDDVLKALGLDRLDIYIELVLMIRSTHVKGGFVTRSWVERVIVQRYPALVNHRIRTKNSIERAEVMLCLDFGSWVRSEKCLSGLENAYYLGSPWYLKLVDTRYNLPMYYAELKAKLDQHKL